MNDERKEMVSLLGPEIDRLTAMHGGLPWEDLLAALAAWAGARAAGEVRGIDPDRETGVFP